MESTKHRTFRRRADGVLGVGFYVQRCGTLQAAIAWPDRGCEHFIADDLDRNGVEELITLTQLPHVKANPAAKPGPVSEIDAVKLEEREVTETASEAPESPENAGETLEEQPVTEAQAIRNYLADHGSGATNKAVIDALKAKGINVTSSQVTREKNALKSEANA